MSSSTSPIDSVRLTDNSQNMGQNCIGLERIIVHESQHDELFDILRKRVEKLRTGSVLTPLEGGFVPTVDVGSMISNDRFDALQAVIENASEKGAVVEGGAAQSHPYHENGLYFKPTLVGHAKPEMDIAQEERTCHLHAITSVPI